MKKNINEICELLLNVMSEFCENDSRARNFGTDTELYHSEIHMLQCIEENPYLHISAIARLMGVTRGAASQTVKRLERKQMLYKEMSPDSEKKVIMCLTSKGKTASLNHRCAHERYNVMISNLLSDASIDQLQFISDFLRRFEESMKKSAVQPNK